MLEKTVLTVCQQPLLRLGLRQVLVSECGLKIIGEVGTASDAMQAISRSRPDLAIVVVGPGFGDGLGLIKDLQKGRNAPPLLVLGKAGDAEHVQRALRAGARGYVTCVDDLSELLLAVASVRSGGLHVSREASNGLLIPVSHRSNGESGNGLGALSDRELEVFRLVGEGLGSKDIAGQLKISVKTVETHRARMKDKLHLHSGSALNQKAALSVMGGRR